MCKGRRAREPGRHLSDDGLSGLVILVEEVVGLNEELAGVLLWLRHPPLPQQHRLIGAFVRVKLLGRTWTLNKTYTHIRMDAKGG